MIDGTPKRKASPKIAITDLSGFVKSNIAFSHNLFRTPSKKARAANRAPKIVDPYLLSPAHTHGKRRVGGTRKKISSEIPYSLEVSSWLFFLLYNL